MSYGKFFISVLCLLFSTTVLAKKLTLQISEIWVDSDNNQLVISGSGFDSPDVSLGAYSGFLVPVSTAEDEVVVELPNALDAGDYKLIVSQGKNGNDQVDYDLTIGAVGPQGEQGPPGADGTGGGADGPCWDETNTLRYVDCGNGTVTDQKSALIWLKDAACTALGNPGGTDWFTAKDNVVVLQDGECGLTDGSQRGDWRLPTYDELWEVMQRLDGVCVTPPYWLNDAGTDCWGTGPSSFTGVESWLYWSNSTYLQIWDWAFYVDLNQGWVTADSKRGYTIIKVWPVRGGPR